MSKAEPSALPATFCGSSRIFTLTSLKPAGVGNLNLLLDLTMSTPSCASKASNATRAA